MKGFWQISVGVLLASIILAAAQNQTGYLTSGQLDVIADPADKADPGDIEIDMLMNGGTDEHKRQNKDSGYLTSNQLDVMADPADKADPGDIEIDMLMNGGSDEHKRGIVMEVEARNFLALPLLTAEEIDQVPEAERSIDEMIGTEDDMRLTPFQELVKKLVEEDKLEELDEVSKRLITSGELSRWPKNIVPYQFQNGLSRDNRILIMQSIKEWQAVTCLRFEPFFNAISLDLDHEGRMYFQNTKAGCWATLGFRGKQAAVGGEYNKVNLEPNDSQGSGCWFKRVILHEIGHGLGLYHQQSRPDRNQNLVVTQANVQPNKWDQYTIPKQGEYVNLERTIPYDYTSVMHYGKNSFVKKDRFGKPAAGFTMRPRQPCYLDVIGNAKKISFYDAKLINLMHKCQQGCGESCNEQQKNRNCYTSKAGNRGCQCLCPDDSEDKCKGKGTNFKCPEEFPGQVVFKCSNGYCLKPELRCDGIDHCGNGHDERNCNGNCPKGDLNPIQLTVGSVVMKTCKQYYANYPTYTCLNRKTKDVCCGTCKQATSPCRDGPDCRNARCQFLNHKNDCPVKCGLARRGERKCPAAAPCTADKAIQLNVGPTTTYSTCAQLFQKYPTYTCTDASFASKCCKTCESAKAPCKDGPDCRNARCQFLNYQNDCPVKCGKAKDGERKCPGAGSSGGSSGGNRGGNSGGSSGGNSGGNRGGNSGGSIGGNMGGSSGGSSGGSGSSSCKDTHDNCPAIQRTYASYLAQVCAQNEWVRLACKKMCGTC